MRMPGFGILAILSIAAVALAEPAGEKVEKKAEKAEAANTKYEVEIDPEFKKRPIKPRPPADADGQKPLDVVQEFLRRVNVGDADGAAKLVSFGNDRPGTAFPSKETVHGEAFGVFCEKVRNHVKHVRLSATTHQDKVTRHVWYEATSHQGTKQIGFFELILENKVWKVIEKPHWRHVASGKDRDPAW